ncbi:MAG: type II toxin-antitoxin system Phd/YefM family antitoxin [Alphaproteobacteria bacterium]|nr:type II toxin-antitoxin system Phd/YefM family antitoxin [Alphaproteobacteria bacterium]
MSRHGQATLSTADARGQLSDILNRAAFGKERVVVSRRGKPLAAVVPLEDIETLEALEDTLDAAEIRKRLLEWEAAGKPGIPLEEVAIRLGVKL